MAIIVAHSDDEVLGAGAQFRHFGKLTFVHVTDGAASGGAARSKGYGTRRAYADARRKELKAALVLACVSAQCRDIGYRDLEASFHMAALARQLARTISDLAPDLILTHAFEGGHPDHDATAYAVHRALVGFAAPPSHWEFAGYHRGPNGMVRSRFPAQPATPVLCVDLDASEQALKRRMLACFQSQGDVVSQFSLAEEIFRPAPTYDFTSARAPETLGYETEGWQIDGRLWRALVVAAERQRRSGLPDPWLALRVRWAMWTRRAYPDRPRLVRLMRACLGDPDQDPD